MARGCIYKVGSRRFRLKARASKYARKHGGSISKICGISGLLGRKNGKHKLGARTKVTTRKSRPF